MNFKRTSTEDTVEISCIQVDFIVQTRLYLFSSCIVIAEMDLHNNNNIIMSKAEDHRKKSTCNVYVNNTNLAKQGK